MPLCDGPGVFIVFMQPSPDLPLTRFHDWYNGEHGPARMALPWVRRGYRFKATDEDKPTWMASYDVANMKHFESEEYTSILSNASDNEKEIRQNLLSKLDRRFYRTLSDEPAEAVNSESTSAPNHVVLYRTSASNESDCGEVLKWYNDEQNSNISGLPGWNRKRVLKLLEPNESEVAALYEYSQAKGTDQSQSHLKTQDAARNTTVRSFSLCHIFADAKSGVSAWDGLQQDQNSFMRLL